MVNTPIPHSLKSEAKKAAKILKEFTFPTAKMGPDKLIPAGIFMKAKGIAILTVVKAGFLVTARGGSGIVIAKTDDGFGSDWSAPSAIGIAGLGGGFEIGAEVTDFVIILNKRSAVEAFGKGGNLTLGGNFTIAAGPVGRNLEADVAVRSQAAIFTYSRTRGIFAGISVEGSALIERKDANKKFYGQDIRAYEILRGDVPQPKECECLYEVLHAHKKKAEKELVKMAKREALKAASGELSSIKASSSLTKRFANFRGSKKEKKEPSRNYDDSDEDWRDNTDTSSRSQSVKSRHVTKRTTTWKSTTTTNRKSSSSISQSPSPKERTVHQSYSPKERTVHQSYSPKERTVHQSYSPKERTFHQSASPKERTVRERMIPMNLQRPRSLSGCSWQSSGSDTSMELTVKALYDFKAQEPCDLSFKKGDMIHVLTRTETHNDWWEGMLGNRVGIFPANLVYIPS